MSNVPSHLKFTKEHEWVEDLGGNRFRVGITDYAQGALGDIVYIQLPKIGDSVQAGSVCGEVESTKSVSEIYAPLTGKITAANSALDAAPEKINGDPYGEGWIIEIEVSDLGSANQLLSPGEYENLTA